MKQGDRVTLAVEKPAAGGRMIARHDGAIVLVSAAIPGERVDAIVEKVQRGTVWARVARILEPSADRIEAGADWSCGGNVFSHIAYERQLALKQEILGDAFARIGRLPLGASPPIRGSPSDGYRMRCRLHVQSGRIGFFREGSHELCDPAATRQLLSSTVDCVRRLESAIRGVPRAHLSEVEIAENQAADQRAIHLDLADTADPSRLGTIGALPGVTGLSCAVAPSQHSTVLSGSPFVTDQIVVPAVSGSVTITVERHVKSFFQGNRYLVPDLVAAVVDAVTIGPVLDLYAGVGVFSLALATRGIGDITAIEGEGHAAQDLKRNASRQGSVIAPRHQSVETFLSIESGTRAQTIVVDPPRTGLSKAAAAGIIAVRPQRIVYVSCDPATLARDARLLADAGFRRESVRAFDLFPNTAHVETIAVFDRT